MDSNVTIFVAVIRPPYKFPLFLKKNSFSFVLCENLLFDLEKCAFGDTPFEDLENSLINEETKTLDRPLASKFEEQYPS